MAYRITNESDKPIHQLFCKYRIWVLVKIILVKISDFLTITFRNTQNKFQFFLPPDLEDMSTTILVKNSKKGFLLSSIENSIGYSCQKL